MRSLKRFYKSLFVLVVIVSASVSVAAQVRVPRPSQKASVMQTIGVTDVTITYHRPGVKGRTIWGEPTADQKAKVPGEATLDNQNERPKDAVIVPWGHVWRTGANENTMFEITDDVLINGQKLAAGKYSLHTIPTKDEWTIVFNGASNQWGSFDYDAAKDTLRVKAKPIPVTDNQEWLQFTIDPINDNSARVNIRWEKLAVPFTVEVPDVNAVTLARARSAVNAAKADDWRTPFDAARYALGNGVATDDQEAMAWLDKSIGVKETFQNLSAKARALFKAGKKEEAIALGERAIQRGKQDKANTATFEKELANIKAGKM
jgi:Protein of unknown function (DUF2911)